MKTLIIEIGSRVVGLIFAAKFVWTYLRNREDGERMLENIKKLHVATVGRKQ